MNQLLQYMLFQTNCANTLNLTTSVSFLKFWSKYFFSKKIHTRLMLQWLLLQSKVRQCAVKLYIYKKYIIKVICFICYFKSKKFFTRSNFYLVSYFHPCHCYLRYLFFIFKQNGNIHYIIKSETYLTAHC